MPFVRISTAKDSLESSQKQLLLQAVLNAVVTVEGEPMRTGIGVALDEGIGDRQWLLNCRAFIILTVIREALTVSQRQSLLQSVTEAVVSAMGEDYRPQVWAVLEESVSNGEWSIGDHKLTIQSMLHINQSLNP